MKIKCRVIITKDHKLFRVFVVRTSQCKALSEYLFNNIEYLIGRGINIS